MRRGLQYRLAQLSSSKRAGAPPKILHHLRTETHGTTRAGSQQAKLSLLIYCHSRPGKRKPARGGNLGSWIGGHLTRRSKTPLFFDQGHGRSYQPNSRRPHINMDHFYSSPKKREASRTRSYRSHTGPPPSAHYPLADLAHTPWSLALQVPLALSLSPAQVQPGSQVVHSTHSRPAIFLNHHQHPLPLPPGPPS